jgi:hypothetical protein
MLFLPKANDLIFMFVLCRDAIRTNDDDAHEATRNAPQCGEAPSQYRGKQRHPPFRDDYSGSSPDYAREQYPPYWTSTPGYGW